MLPTTPALSVDTDDAVYSPGADPGLQVRGGAHLKKLRRAEGGANIFGVFLVKNHDFTPKNHIFFNFRGARAGCTPLAEHKARFVACRDSSSPSGLTSTTAHLIILRSTASTKSTFLGGLISIELSINHFRCWV